MDTKLLFVLAGCLIVAACNRRERQPEQKQTIPPVIPITKKVKKQPVPIWGYRFRITGDFNGDGKQDTLTEHFVNGITHREMNKYFDLGGNEDVYDEARFLEPYHVRSFASSGDKKIRPLLNDSDCGFGFRYLHNEHDLDGDGADEVSYITDYADFSTINFLEIMTYKKGHWYYLYSFVMHEDDVPDLPYASDTYTISSKTNLGDFDKADTADANAERRLLAYPGKITRLRNGKIKITTIKSDATDSVVIVNLKHRKLSPVTGF